MKAEIAGSAPIKLRGVPITLNAYDGAGTITNRYFRSFQMPELGRVYLPDSVKPFTDTDPIATRELLIDDNRSAVSREPYMAIDGTDFYLSVKGIGSTTSPFSRQLLKKEEVSSLLKALTRKRVNFMLELGHDPCVNFGRCQPVRNGPVDLRIAVKEDVFPSFHENEALRVPEEGLGSVLDGVRSEFPRRLAT